MYINLLYTCIKLCYVHVYKQSNHIPRFVIILMFQTIYAGRKGDESPLVFKIACFLYISYNEISGNNLVYIIL